MQGTVSKMLVLGVLSLSLAFSVNAKSYDNGKQNNKHHKWLCETNASGAATDADKKADEMMSTKAKSGKDAFMYALKNCRDCTKITCTAEENATANNNNHRD